MSKGISLYPTTLTGADTPQNVTGSTCPGDKFGMDVKVCNGLADPVPVIIVEGSGGDTTRTIYNIALGPVDTEQSQALPADTKKFLIKTRGTNLLKLAFVMGDSGTDFITIKGGAVYTDDQFTSSITLYFQSPGTGDVVEIIAYS